MFPTLFRWLWYVNPYLQYVFTAVLFVASGKKIRMRILLYCTISTYDNITVHEIRLVFACSTVVISVPRILCLRIC